MEIATSRAGRGAFGSGLVFREARRPRGRGAAIAQRWVTSRDPLHRRAFSRIRSADQRSGWIRFVSRRCTRNPGSRPSGYARNRRPPWSTSTAAPARRRRDGGQLSQW